MLNLNLIWIALNPQYKTAKRIGCMVCPKAGFKSNYITLMQYPKLIDCFILARERANRKDLDWKITADNKDYTGNKVEYICRWLNHSFRQFSKIDKKLYDDFVEHYKKNKR